MDFLQSLNEIFGRNKEHKFFLLKGFEDQILIRDLYFIKLIFYHANYTTHIIFCKIRFSLKGFLGGEVFLAYFIEKHRKTPFIQGGKDVKLFKVPYMQIIKAFFKNGICLSGKLSELSWPNNFLRLKHCSRKPRTCSKKKNSFPDKKKWT